jgi:DNA repair protein RecO (recombination protein O)
MRELRSYPTEAIILKQSDLGEADRILTLFTPRKGKFNAIAKGIRRPISRKTGHLDLLCHTQLQVAVGRNLDIITQAQTIEGYAHLHENMWYLTCGFYLAELVDRFIEDSTPHPDVYDLLLASLRALNNESRSNGQPVATHQQGEPTSADQEKESIPENDLSRLLMRYFEIYLLASVGYEPVLRSCANCGTELRPEENGFTPSLGGALCPNCSHLWSYPISMNALKVLRLLHRTEWAQVPRLRLDPRLHAEMERAMHSLIRFHLERDMQSWSFLHMLRD